MVFILLGLLSMGLTDDSIQTPLETSDYSSLSSHQDMLSYLEKLAISSENLTLKIIGQSVEERDLPALFYSLEKKLTTQRSQKPLVLIFCQQHGDEPSGKEAALVLARDLLDNYQYLLESLDIILIPQLNSDGAEKGERRNANDMDLNRNHAILSEPESMALHNLFYEWMPEVTLDVHEYNAITELWVSNGFVKDAEEQLGKLSNLNVAKPILDYSGSIIVPAVAQKVRSAGFTFHEYVVGTPFENDRLRYSTTAINDGRQSLGIYNTFSFILEGKKYNDLLTNIQRRVAGQVTAMVAFLETIGENANLVLEITRQSREALLSEENLGKSRAYIQMDYYPDSTNYAILFPVFNLETWKKEEKELKNYHANVRVRKSVRKPLAYVVPASEKELISVLSRHHIEMKEIKQSTSMDVETYQVLHVTSYIEEEVEVPYVDIEMHRSTKQIEKGSVIIPLNQAAGNLIPLLLEPQSTFNLCREVSGRKYRFANYLTEGTVYPVYRLMKPSP
jgi:hypothetical protein